MKGVNKRVRTTEMRAGTSAKRVLAKVARTIQSMDLGCHVSDGCHQVQWHDASCHPTYRPSGGGCH